MGSNFGDFAEGFLSTAGANIKERRKLERETLAKEQERRLKSQDEFDLYKKKTDFKLDKQVLFDKAEEERKATRDKIKADERRGRLDNLLLSFDTRKDKKAVGAPQIDLDDALNLVTGTIAEFGKDSDEAAIAKTKFKDILRLQERGDKPVVGVSGGRDLDKAFNSIIGDPNKFRTLSPFFKKEVKVKGSKEHKTALVDAKGLATKFLENTTAPGAKRSELREDRVASVTAEIMEELSVFREPKSTEQEQVAALKKITELLPTVNETPEGFFTSGRYANELRELSQSPALAPLAAEAAAIPRVDPGVAAIRGINSTEVKTQVRSRTINALKARTRLAEDDPNFLTNKQAKELAIRQGLAR